MVVYISDEVSYLKEKLIEKGYKVITSNNKGTPCDAIICNLKNGGLASVNMQNDNIKMEGTLIIDIGSKNINEIEDILNNRVYSSIFT